MGTLAAFHYYLKAEPSTPQSKPSVVIKVDWSAANYSYCMLPVRLTSPCVSRYLGYIRRSGLGSARNYVMCLVWLCEVKSKDFLGSRGEGGIIMVYVILHQSQYSLDVVCVLVRTYCSMYCAVARYMLSRLMTIIGSALGYLYHYEFRHLNR